MASNSNNKKQQWKPEASTRTEAAPVYSPSIYTYKCRGAYFLSSDQQGSEGVCRGLRTRLELLSDMESNTREAAIKDFTYMTDFEIDEDEANTLNQKTKSILVSPAIIYEEKTSSDEQSPKLPEEELIQRQSWSCYGSTDVQYLVLKNQNSGDEHIAAVAPRNLGISIRKIEAEDNSITSVDFGWLNVVVDAAPKEEDEKEREAEQQQPNMNRVAPVDDAVPPRPRSKTIANSKEYAGQFYNFSLKVAEQMKHNSKWLYENLQDDFPARTYSAGEKIITNLPRTVERTGKFMVKIFNRWQGQDDGDGED